MKDLNIIQSMRYPYFFFLLFTLAPFMVMGNTSSLEALKKEASSLPSGVEKVDVLNELGVILIKEDYLLASEYGQEALEIAQQLNYNEGIGESKRNLALATLKMGDTDKALQLLEEGLEIAQQNEYALLEARSFWSLGYYWHQLGQYQKSLDYLRSGKALFDKFGDAYWVASSHIQLGWNRHENGDDKEAEHHFEQGVVQSEDFPRLHAEAQYCIAGFFLNKNTNFNLAYNHLREGLKIAEENQLPRHLAQLQTALGGLHQRLGEDDKAKSYYSKALVFFESAKYYKSISWLHEVIGSIALDAEEFDLALDHFNSALAVQDKLGSKIPLTNLYCSIGHTYYKRDQDYNKAVGYYYKALDLANESGSQFSKANVELALGYAYVDLEEYEKAIHWCEKSLSRTSISLETSKSAYERLAIAYSKMGQYKSAFKYQEQFRILQDSVHKEEIFIQNSSLEFRDQYEKELAKLQQEQAIEKEQSKTKMAWVIAGLSLLFMTAILFLSIANVKRTAQKDQLVAVAKIRKELIANVSHDLRTPITIMQGYVETLLMKMNTSTVSEREKYLNIVLGSLDKLSSLISQLFEFSKLEADQIKAQKTPFPINDLLKTSLEKYKILAEQKDVQIEINCPECEPVVYADISLIERVIQNLMDNALKFTPKKGKIQVAIVDRDQKVEVSITDTGSGISEENQVKIFERHEKSKDSKGAGLGLAIVQKIVELHEGVVSVKSELGKGTQFIFSLPTYQMAS